MFRNFIIRIFKKISYSIYYSFVAKSQNNNKEAIELFEIFKKTKINKSFIEFGVHPFELNSHIFLRKNFKGLLIDSSSANCEQMNAIIKKLKVSSTAINHF